MPTALPTTSVPVHGDQHGGSLADAAVERVKHERLEAATGGDIVEGQPRLGRIKLVLVQTKDVQVVVERPQFLLPRG